IRSLADSIGSVRAALQRIQAGDLDTRCPVDDGSEVGLLQAGFNRMVVGLEERERLREAFGTFVDPELGERILQEGTDLAGVEAATRETDDDVLITEATRERLQREHCAWQRRPPIPLKGKSESVALYAPA